MNAAELTAALATVEQDHQLVLDQVQALKDAVTALLEPEVGDLPGVLDRLRQSNAFFATHLEAHLDEEEVTLFPLLEQLRPEGAELVARLRREHEMVRSKREEFDSCLHVALELEGAVTRTVIWDLLVYGWELWEILDRHAHDETRGVHQCLAAQR